MLLRKQEPRVPRATLVALGLAQTTALVGAVVVALVSFAFGAALMWLLTLVLPPEIPVAVLPARGVQIAVGLVVMSTLGAVVSLRRVVRVDPASAIG